jgi:hypothetical protein
MAQKSPGAKVSLVHGPPGRELDGPTKEPDALTGAVLAKLLKPALPVME